MERISARTKYACEYRTNYINFFLFQFFTRDSTTSDNRACPSRPVSQTVHCNSGRAKKSERFGSGRRKEGPIFLSSFFRPDPNLHLVLPPPLLHLHYLPGLGLESIKKSSSSWLTFSGSSWSPDSIKHNKQKIIKNGFRKRSSLRKELSIYSKRTRTNIHHISMFHHICQNT